MAFRDYGLCLGPVTNYIDNITVAACYGDYDYTGKKIDGDTGLVYFGGRWYDPEVGRFMTVDPAKDGLNWYEYCNNNPINFIDPFGLYTLTDSEGNVIDVTDNGDLGVYQLPGGDGVGPPAPMGETYFWNTFEVGNYINYGDDKTGEVQKLA